MVKRIHNAVLEIFRDVATRCGVSHCKCKDNNSLPRPSKCFTSRWLKSNGIEITLPDSIIIVHADTHGIAHLVRYWHVMAQIIDKDVTQIILFYIYLGKLHGKGNTWREDWEFITNQILHGVGHRLEAYFAVCSPHSQFNCHDDIPPKIMEDLLAQLEAQGILKRFKNLLEVPVGLGE